MPPASSSSDALDVAALSAQLSVDRSALADQILSRLGASTSAASSASKPAKQKEGKPKAQRDEQPRPPTLGLGAKPTQQKGNQQVGDKLNQEDARLKGRLTGGIKRKREVAERVAEERDGRATVQDEEEEDEESRAGAVAQGNKKKGRKDPFATQAMQKAAAGGGAKGKANEATPALAPTPTATGQQELSKKARKKLNKAKREAEEAAKATAATSTAQAAEPAVAEEISNVSPAGPTSSSLFGSSSNLTSHQRSLLTKLSGGRFRQINEELYTTPSSSALRMMRQDPAVMEAYHEGFREQTKSWPDVPVKVIARMIREGVSGEGKKGKGKGKMQISCGKAPLIVDLGAGEALLGKELGEAFKDTPETAPRVLSYDLLDSADGFVRGLDMGERGAVPLPGKGSEKGGGCLARAFDKTKSEAKPQVVDVAVFCLSLMGTNWVDMVCEARRVLRDGATLIIAEVASRFSSIEAFVDVVEALGFKLDGKDTSNTHFSLLIFTKLDLPSLVAKLGKEASKMGSLEACIKADAKEEAALIEKGKEVLKPCIYKRR